MDCSLCGCCVVIVLVTNVESFNQGILFPQVKEFDELIREIKAHISDVDKSRETALRSDKFTDWSAKWPVRPSNFREMLWSGPRGNTAAATKAATASASVLTDTETKVDESWLEGTNAQLAKKVTLSTIDALMWAVKFAKDVVKSVNQPRISYLLIFQPAEKKDSNKKSDVKAKQSNGGNVFKHVKLVQCVSVAVIAVPLAHCAAQTTPLHSSHPTV